MKGTRLAVDLAKGVFQAVLADGRSKIVWKARWRRHQVLKKVARLEPCVVVMEACGSSHYWAREIGRLGHEVVLIPAHRVKAYRQGQKNDLTDALAILEASYRADLKPVPVKSESQQELHAIYMIRRRLIGNRTALANQIRGLLGEFGHVLPKGLSTLRRRLPELLEALDGYLAVMMADQYEELRALDERIKQVTRRLEQMAKQDERSRRLMRLPGIGPITAVLLTAHCCPQAYKNGRGYSAVLGLVPGQHSSGDRIRLSPITRSGNQEIRMSLIHGGRSVVRCSDRHDDEISQFARRVRDRRGKNIAAVAVANKLARQAWAELKAAA